LLRLRVFRNLPCFIFKYLITHRMAFFSLSFPALIRSIPELIAGPWPLGFDTVSSYAPFVKIVQTQGLEPAFAGLLWREHVAPLLYWILGLIASFISLSPFAVTKSIAPLLYALLGVSLYSFARRGLVWDQKKAFLLVIIASLYFVPLRLSWDLYKNTLGYAFFLP